MPSAAPPAGCLHASVAPRACGSPACRAVAVLRSPAGNRNAVCARRRSSGSSTVPPCPLPRDPAPAATGRIPPGSHPPTDTSARYPGCLALTSVPGFGHRCRLARLRIALASSLDFLQGTFEKICFQRFVRHQALQLRPLEPELALPAVLRWRFPIVNRFQLVAPLIEQPSMHTELCRQRNDVVAVLQSLNCHLPEGLGISSHSSFCHLQFLSLQSVP